MSLRDERWVVIDLETNGLSASHGGEVIETGAVRLDPGRPAETFHALSRPVRPIPAAAVRVHGITNEAVAGCEHFFAVLPRLLEFVGDRILVAHNAPFDRSFLDAALASTGRESLANPFVDTLRLSRALCPELDGHDLESLCVHHRIARAERHRALPDALATAELLGLLLPAAEERGVDTMGKLREVAGCRRAAREGTPEVALDESERALLAEAAVTGDRVEIRYRTAGGGLRPATVVPYLVDGAGRVPRLVAFDLDRGVTRTFRLDRVLAVRPSAGRGVGEDGGV